MKGQKLAAYTDFLPSTILDKARELMQKADMELCPSKGRRFILYGSFGNLYGVELVAGTKIPLAQPEQLMIQLECRGPVKVYG